MASPFPGMNPYIEDPKVWSDFHGGLAKEIRRRLNRMIQPRYVAQLTPYVTYETVAITRPTGIRPDVGVWPPQPPAGRVAESVAVITPAPIEVAVDVDVSLRLYSVEIHETEALELVTAIEILSPVNKRPGHEAYEKYHRKRNDLRHTAVHLLELDLLRGGERLFPETAVRPAPYYAALSRVERRPYFLVWPIALQDKLPVLPVPLRAPDPDVALDLGATVATVYQDGAYDVLIDYRRDPPPPRLAESELKWLDGHLRAQGRR